MKPKDGRPEYIEKDGVLFQYIDERAYGREMYVACPMLYHYWSFRIGDVE